MRDGRSARSSIGDVEKLPCVQGRPVDLVDLTYELDGLIGVEALDRVGSGKAPE